MAATHKNRATTESPSPDDAGLSEDRSSSDFSPHVWQTLNDIQGQLGGIKNELTHINKRIENIEKTTDSIKGWQKFIGGAIAVCMLFGGAWSFVSPYVTVHLK